MQFCPTLDNIAISQIFLSGTAVPVLYCSSNWLGVFLPIRPLTSLALKSTHALSNCSLQHLKHIAFHKFFSMGQQCNVR